MGSKKCKKCNKEFTPTDTSEKVRNGRKYCSWECYTKSLKGQAKTRKGVYKNCENCNKEFYTPQSRKGKRFCCGECRDDYMATDVWNFLLYQCKKSASSKSGKRGAHLNVVSITTDDLKSQWKKQGGICAYSGYPLALPNYKRDIENQFTRASVDRIDSSKGYIRGNIQFVSKPINYLKGTISNSQVRHFFDTYYEMRKFMESEMSDGEICTAKTFWL